MEVGDEMLQLFEQYERKKLTIEVSILFLLKGQMAYGQSVEKKDLENVTSRFAKLSTSAILPSLTWTSIKMRQRRCGLFLRKTFFAKMLLRKMFFPHSLRLCTCKLSLFRPVSLVVY